MLYIASIKYIRIFTYRLQCRSSYALHDQKKKKFFLLYRYSHSRRPPYLCVRAFLTPLPIFTRYLNWQEILSLLRIYLTTAVAVVEIEESRVLLILLSVDVVVCLAVDAEEVER